MYPIHIHIGDDCMGTTALFREIWLGGGGGVNPPPPASSDLPPGTIIAFAGSTAPTGWLMMDGSAVSQATYADLFAIIGTTYGDPGGGNFNLPDLRGRVPLGAGPGPGLTTRVLAASGGQENITDVPAHTHGFAPPCLEDEAVTANPAGAYPSETAVNHYGTSTDASMGAGTTMSTGPSSVDVMNPFLALNYIIKT